MLLAACRLVQNLLREITFHWGSEDLADIDLQTEEDRVRVRCFFR